MIGGTAGAGAGTGESVASETVLELVGVAGELRFPWFELNGFIEVDGWTVGNLDMSAICAELVDARALMLGLEEADVEVGVATVLGALTTLVGEFEAAGGGFIMTGGGFIMTGVGFIMAGVGFMMTGIGFMMTGIGFVMGSMAGIPDAMDSSALPSSVSTEIDAFRRNFRDIIVRRSCS